MDFMSKHQKLEPQDLIQTSNQKHIQNIVDFKTMESEVFEC